MKKQQMLKIAKLASRQRWVPAEQQVLRRELVTKAENKAYNEPEDVFENIWNPTPEQLERMEKANKRDQRCRRLAIRRKNREFSVRALKIHYKTGKRAY